MYQRDRETKDSHTNRRHTHFCVHIVSRKSYIHTSLSLYRIYESRSVRTVDRADPLKVGMELFMRSHVTLALVKEVVVLASVVRSKRKGSRMRLEGTNAVIP